MFGFDSVLDHLESEFPLSVVRVFLAFLHQAPKGNITHEESRLLILHLVSIAMSFKASDKPPIHVTYSRRKRLRGT